MKIKQISIFLENRKGRLHDALKAIAKAKINIRALSIADTQEFGILRLIVNEPDQAKKVLEKNYFIVRENEVIAVGVPDTPGGLAGVLEVLQKADLNVEYIYAFVEKSGEKAVVVLRTENVDAGIKTLQAAGVEVLKSKEVYKL